MKYYQLPLLSIGNGCEVRLNTELDLMIAITVGESSSNWYKTNRVQSVYLLR